MEEEGWRKGGGGGGRGGGGRGVERGVTQYHTQGIYLTVISTSILCFTESEFFG